MRIVAGRYRGQRLLAPRGDRTRPTADRVREALFNVLGDLDGARVLDLFAGTGAVGLEALSRGAANTLFVERSRDAGAVLRRNLESLGVPAEAVRLWLTDARGALRRILQKGERFELVFADPPYEQVDALMAPVLAVADDLLSPDGELVLEHRSDRHPPAPPPGLVVRATRRYGEAALTFYDREESTHAPVEPS